MDASHLQAMGLPPLPAVLQPSVPRPRLANYLEADEHILPGKGVDVVRQRAQRLLDFLPTLTQAPVSDGLYREERRRRRIEDDWKLKKDRHGNNVDRINRVIDNMHETYEVTTSWYKEARGEFAEASWRLTHKPVRG
jgi:hypothetical protein